MQHLAAIGAQEFYSWFSTPTDDARGTFARFLLYPSTTPNAAQQLREAATIARAALEEEGRDAFLVLDGTGAINLWLPLAGAPLFDDILAYARSFAHTLAQRRPDPSPSIPTCTPTAASTSTTRTTSQTRGPSSPTVTAPARTASQRPSTGKSSHTCDLLGIPAQDFELRLHQTGDVFAHELAACNPKPLPTHAAHTPTQMYGGKPGGNKRGTLLQAAVNILADGKARTADEILAQALKAGVIAHTTAAVLYVSLISYITRCQGRGRKPAIVEDPDKRFRLNEPPDAWPALAPPPPPPPLSKEHAQIIERLRATSTGDDPTAFEVAVCDAFRALNFIATHVGGRAAPDAYIDAQLGVLGYRVMIECKSGTAVHGPNIYEAAKYKDVYNATYCALVGPDFGDQVEIIQECKNHGVSAWSIDDLETLIRMNANALDMQALFQPGIIAADALEDLIWEEHHGRAKRIRIIAQIIRDAGWSTQCAAAQSGPPPDAPILTEDAAMILVDQSLHAQNSPVNCSRAEVRAALTYLTHPLIHAATQTPDATGIVILQP